MSLCFNLSASAALARPREAGSPELQALHSRESPTLWFVKLLLSKFNKKPVRSSQIEETSRYKLSHQRREASCEKYEAKGVGQAGLGGHGHGENHHHAGDVATEGEAKDDREGDLSD